jgi:proteasome accessory factor C
LGIVTYLDRNGATEIGDLADHFGVTADQVRADVAMLSVSGLPGHWTDDLIDFDFAALDRGIVDITNSQGVTQVKLSGREAVALLGAVGILVESGAAPQAAVTLRQKLQEALGGVATVEVVGASHVDPATRLALLDAIERLRIATVTYIDAQDRLTERTIEPHRLVSIDGIGYVECYCRRAADYRTLRLDRIAAVAVLEDQVQVPPSDATGFALEPLVTARVVVARSGRWAFEDLPGVSLQDVGDDVEASFGVADPEWAAGRLLAVAPYLRLVEPAEVRDALNRRANAVLSAHAE